MFLQCLKETFSLPSLTEREDERSSLLLISLPLSVPSGVHTPILPPG